MRIKGKDVSEEQPYLFPRGKQCIFLRFELVRRVSSDEQYAPCLQNKNINITVSYLLTDSLQINYAVVIR
jgi:hypothetical protein